MFDKGILETDAFMDMPMATKALYFLLGMEADDEGFVSPKRVLRLYGGNEDDLKILIAKGFAILFESGVIVITNWHENNYLDKNKVKDTRYQAEKALITLKGSKYARLTESLTEVDQKLTQYSIEENRVEENSIEQNSIAETSSADVNHLLNSFKEDINPTISFGNKTQRKACEELIRQFGFEKVVNTLNYYKSIRGEKFSPVITTPCQLRDKMGQLIAYYNKNHQSFGDKVIDI